MKGTKRLTTVRSWLMTTHQRRLITTTPASVNYSNGFVTLSHCVNKISSVAKHWLGERRRIVSQRSMRRSNELWIKKHTSLRPKINSLRTTRIYTHYTTNTMHYLMQETEERRLMMQAQIFLLETFPCFQCLMLRSMRTDLILKIQKLLFLTSYRSNWTMIGSFRSTN